MSNSEKRITIELIDKNKSCESKMSNPINCSISKRDNIKQMVHKILEEEIPQLKDNTLLQDMVVYSLIEKMHTVQTIENVLSYIKGNNAKTVQDVSFKKGEIRIKCST